MTPRLDRAWVKAALPPGIAVAVVAALHFGVFAGRAREARNFQDSARTLQTEQASMSLDTQQLTAWLHREGAGREDQTAGDTLSLGAAIPALLQRIAALSEAHGIRVLSIRPDAPGAPIATTAPDGAQASYARLPVRVVATARFQDLGAFLEELEGHGGLARISSVRLSLDHGHHALAVELVVDAFGRIPG